MTHTHGGPLPAKRGACRNVRQLQAKRRPAQATAGCPHPTPHPPTPPHAPFSQIGGSRASVDAHIAAVSRHPLLRGADIDFKIAPSAGPLSEGTLRESGFERLTVAVCKVGRGRLLLLRAAALKWGMDRSQQGGSLRFSPDDALQAAAQVLR